MIAGDAVGVDDFLKGVEELVSLEVARGLQGRVFDWVDLSWILKGGIYHWGCFYCSFESLGASLSLLVGNFLGSRPGRLKHCGTVASC